MDPLSQDWKPIAPRGVADTSVELQSSPSGARSPRVVPLVLGALGAVAFVAAALTLAATTPQPTLSIAGSASSPPDTTRNALGVDADVPSATPSLAPPTATEPWVVDVAGAVSRPGVYRLPPGSRVGDAIAAAGGFGLDADAEAVAGSLNLAQVLDDGVKVRVPGLGDGPSVDTPAPGTTGLAGTGGTSAAPPASGPPVAGGLIDLNHADGPTLETLPGIGPVTAGKILSARAQAPFGSVDELLVREVVGPATLEKIRALVTVGP